MGMKENRGMEEGGKKKKGKKEEHEEPFSVAIISNGSDGGREGQPRSATSGEVP